MKESLTNRRKNHRVSLLSFVELLLEEGIPSLEAYCLNVSYSGMAVYTHHSLSVGTQIQATIHYLKPIQGIAFERISGTVKWCQPVGPMFGMGFEFHNPNPKEHAILLAFLDLAEPLYIVPNPSLF